jgi:hypothetical protein
MGKNSQSRGDKIIRKNSLIKDFSNEIKSRTFSRLEIGETTFFTLGLGPIFGPKNTVGKSISSQIGPRSN